MSNFIIQWYLKGYEDKIFTSVPHRIEQDQADQKILRNLPYDHPVIYIHIVHPELKIKSPTT